MGKAGRAETAGNQSPAFGYIDGSIVNITYGGRPFAFHLKSAWIPLNELVTDPSRLLRARAAVVPYLDRAGQLKKLSEWLSGADPFSIRVIGGRGGSGKTRLAVQLCRAVPEGWVSGFLGPIPFGSIPNEQIAGGSETGPGMLVIIDYAETRTELGTLLSALQRAAAPARPIRVVLLIRRSPRKGSDWTSVLRSDDDELDAILDIAAGHQIVLEEAAWDLEARDSLYHRSWNAFADRLEKTGGNKPGEVPSPPNLIAAGFGNPLLVSATAYLAVHDPELTMPDTREGLLEGILRHEAAHWTRSKDLPEDWDGTVAKRATAMAALAGADNETEGAELLHHVPDLEGEGTTGLRRAGARWYHEFYRGPRFWSTLEPDLLGEHLIASTLGEFPSALSASIDPLRGPNVAQPLIVIARIATTNQSMEAYPDFDKAGAAVLQRNLKGLTRAAVDDAVTPPADSPGPTIASALAQAVTALSRHLGDVSEILAALGRPSVPRLNALALALSRHQIAWLKKQTAPLTELPALATALHQHSVALTASGNRKEALTSITEAVEIRRKLVRTSPESYLPHLASALHERAIALTELGGRHEEALKTIDEAEQIQRNLVEAGPDTDLPGLATALNEKSIALARSGDHRKALDFIYAAEDIFRRLADEDPDGYLPDLAKVLNNKSNRLVKVGKPEEALTAITEAVKIRRDQVERSPGQFLSSLATALNNQSNRLGDIGKYNEALPPITEALKIRKDLAADDPGAFLKDVATALNNLATRLGDLGQEGEALVAITEAVQIRRDLAKDDPDAFLPDLATALNNLAIRHAALGQHQDALVAIEESIKIRRPMAEARPKSFLPNLATALSNKSSVLASFGRNEESLAAATEAVSIRYRLSQNEPDAYRPALASAMNNRSNALAARGFHDDALTVIRETVEIRREMAGHRPEVFLPQLSMSLNNASNRLAQLNHNEEAEAAANESVKILRTLVTHRSDAFLLKLAAALINHSISLSSLGRYEEALSRIAESTRIFGNFYEARPGIVLPYSAAALCAESNALARLHRKEEALTAINKSVEILQRLTELFPDAFLPLLAKAQINQAQLMKHMQL